jgi:ABC-type Fe3+ transport system permease subunit
MEILVILIIIILLVLIASRTARGSKKYESVRPVKKISGIDSGKRSTYIHMKIFWKNTIVVLIVLAVVIGIAWYYSAGEQFVRISLICCGYLLGRFSAWFTNYFYSGKQPKQ